MPSAPVLVAVPDLLLQSRILGAAKQLGVRCTLASNADEVLAQARAERPALIVFDLESPRVRAEQALLGLRADAALRDIPTLGFYGHVQVQVGQRAKEAGITQLMTRGEFVNNLEKVLAPFAPRP